MTALVAAPFAAVLLLVGCATTAPEPPPPAVERSRTLGGLAPDAAFERTLAAIRGAGLDVTGANEAGGVITAKLDGFRDRGWAECTARRVTDRGGDQQRIRRADQLDRRVELTATVRAAPAGGGGGAEVTLDPVFAERQRNSFTNTTFLEDCRSTGTLERRLLDSI